MNAPLTPAELRAAFIAARASSPAKADAVIATYLKQERSNWWHDPKARPPHHKCKNVRLSGKAYTGAAYKHPVKIIEGAWVLAEPPRQTSEERARNALQRILDRRHVS